MLPINWEEWWEIGLSMSKVSRVLLELFVMIVLFLILVIIIPAGFYQYLTNSPWHEGMSPTKLVSNFDIDGCQCCSGLAYSFTISATPISCYLYPSWLILSGSAAVSTIDTCSLCFGTVCIMSIWSYVYNMITFDSTTTG